MASQSRMFAIVVASGTASRFGSNKLNELIGSETVLERSVRIAKSVCDGVIVVTDPQTYVGPKVDAVVIGGDTRSQSVRNGLAVLPKDVEIVAVHDGARPGATQNLYELGRELIEHGHVAAIPVIHVHDTIKEIEGDRATTTLDRSTLRSVQTPQIFNARTLRAAYDNNHEDTDDAALVEAMGEHVMLFEGSLSNRKITTPEDLVYLRNVLIGASIQGTPRIGTGYDIHPFGNDETKKLVLGGVQFDHIGLEGHSDSDAVAHALTDALLSAIGAPDLGTLFPASDRSNKNASSLVFLEKAVTLVQNEGYFLGNVSIIINAQEPKLAPLLDEMKKKIAESLTPVSNQNTQISITPKHGEGIGEIGAGKAIAVYATALILPISN